jgi:hypothetical protein
MTKSAGADLNSAKRWPEGRVYRKYASNTASDVGNKVENSFAKKDIKSITDLNKARIRIVYRFVQILKKRENIRERYNSPKERTMEMQLTNSNQDLNYKPEKPSGFYQSIQIINALPMTQLSLTIQLSNPGAGSLNAPGANYNSGTGTLSASSSSSTLNSILSQVMFTAAPNYSEAVTLSITVTDGFFSTATGGDPSLQKSPPTICARQVYSNTKHR